MSETLAELARRGYKKWISEQPVCLGWTKCNGMAHNHECPMAGREPPSFLDAYAAGFRAASPPPNWEEKAARKIAEIPVKPRCLDCNSAGITNCSEFDKCSGRWIYRVNKGEVLAILRS